jgi:hypothetical protein
MAEKVIINIEANTGKAEKSLNSLDKSIKKTSSSAGKAGKGLSGAFSGLSSSISSAIPMLGKLKMALVSTGVGAIVVAIGSLVTLFKKAADIGADFQKSLSTLSAVTGKTSDELRVLNEQAKELGSSTQFTAIQVVQLQTELAKLGFTIKDIENSTPAILDLAASLEVDLASAAEFAGSVVRSFGLTTKETQRVVDVMALSTSKSALNFSALQESLKVVAPASRATGVSVEKTAALLGILANNGLKGSVAGTGLSKTFIELNKKGITLEEGMDKVRNSTNKLNTAIDLVGQVGAKSFLSLAESGKEINQLEKDFIGAEGAAKRMAEVRLDNLAGDTTKLSSAWEGFLLGLEDGEGSINEIQRGAIQLLTKGISKLGNVLDFLAFTFTETWTNTKLLTSGSVDFLVGSFNILGNSIKLFANQALLQISKIPIIGKAIDKGVVNSNIEEAKEAIVKGSKTLEDATDKFRQVSINRLTSSARFSVQQEAKARRTEIKKQDIQDRKLEEERIKQKQQLTDEQKEKLEKEREELAKIDAKTKKQAEDLEDQTELEKAERKRERALKELEAVELSETEKREAKKRINDYYDTIEAEAEIVDNENKKAAEEKSLREKESLANKEIELEAKKTAAKYKALNQLVGIFGAESKMGKAALIGKQLLAAQELLIDLGVIKSKATKTIAVANLDGAKSSSDVASGLSATLKLGFPAAIPALIGYGAAAVGIVSGVLAATKKTKSVASGLGGSGDGGGITPPKTPVIPRIETPTSQSLPPAFNVVGASGTSQLADAIGGQSQQPIQAYVVSNDVTTAQEMDRNIVTGASIG